MYKILTSITGLSAVLAISGGEPATAGGNGRAGYHISGSGDVDVVREADGEIDSGTLVFNVTLSADGQRNTVTGGFTDPANDVEIAFQTWSGPSTDYLGRVGFWGFASLNGMDGFRYVVWLRDGGGPNSGDDRFDIHVTTAPEVGNGESVYDSNGCGEWDETCGDTGVVTSGDIAIHEHR